MSVFDRKAELERKKAKLAAMREGRLKRSDQLNGTGSQITFKIDSVADGDADSILKDLGLLATLDLTKKSPRLDELSHSSSSPALRTKTHINQRSTRNLSISKVNEVNLAPKERVSYSKDTQTVIEVQCETSSVALDTWNSVTPRRPICSPRGMPSFEWDDELLEALPYEYLEPIVPADVGKLLKNLNLSKQDDFFQQETPTHHPPRQLTEDDIACLMKSEPFLEFFTRSSCLMERALDEDADIFFDYSGADRNVLTDQQLLKAERTFFDEQWTANRIAVSLDWSTVYPELLLGVYSDNEVAPHEPHGVCLIWNMKYKKSSPEYIFNYQAAITSAILTEFNPSLVIGGTYAGEIVLWDIRCNRRTPVQRSPMSGLAHAEPIKALAVTGSQNAHTLVSVSSEGKICSWSLDMLGKPTQSLELSYRQTKGVSPTSMAFLSDDVNNFFIGSHDGSVYAVSRNENEASISEMYEGHRAPVTSIATRNVDGGGSSDTPQLFVTTSFDCTVKLWSKKETSPIFSSDDRSDGTLDCDWSPIHPALFATSDLTGQLDLWNLNSDPEVPTASIMMDGDVSLNACKFQKKGSHIAVGDSRGRVRLFELHEKLAVPRSDEWSKFSRLVNSFSSAVTEQRQLDSKQPRYSVSNSVQLPSSR